MSVHCFERRVDGLFCFKQVYPLAKRERPLSQRYGLCLSFSSSPPPRLSERVKTRSGPPYRRIRESKAFPTFYQLENIRFEFHVCADHLCLGAAITSRAPYFFQLPESFIISFVYNSYGIKVFSFLEYIANLPASSKCLLTPVCNVRFVVNYSSTITFKLRQHLLY